MKILNYEEFVLNESLYLDIKNNISKYPKFIKNIKYMYIDYNILEFDEFYKKYQIVLQNRVSKEDLKYKLDEINEGKKFSKFMKFLKIILVFLLSGLTSGVITGIIASTDRFKERLVNNIEPACYGDFNNKISHFIQNDKQYARDKYDSLPNDMKIRVDCFRKYLGLEVFGNLIKKSKYTPKNSKDENINYHTYDGVDTIVINTLYELLEIDNINDLYKSINDYKLKYGKKSRPIVTAEGIFGNATIDIGIDDKGMYISIYDEWDLDMMNFKSTGKYIGMDLSWVSIDNFYGHPIDFYDRIYLNSKVLNNNVDTKKSVDILRNSTLGANQTKETDLGQMISHFGIGQLVKFTIKEFEIYGLN